MRYINRRITLHLGLGLGLGLLLKFFAIARTFCVTETGGETVSGTAILNTTPVCKKM